MEIAEVLEWAVSNDVNRIIFEPLSQMVVPYEIVFLSPWKWKGAEQFGFLSKGFHLRCSQSAAPHDAQRCHEGGF